MREKSHQIQLARSKQIEFRNGSKARIRTDISGTEILTISNKTGQREIRIQFNQEGNEVQIYSQDVSINASEKLTLKARNIRVDASENIRVNCKGNYIEKVAYDKLSKARIQHIEAHLGNVNVKANDDVCIDGERVNLNCE